MSGRVRSRRNIKNLLKLFFLLFYLFGNQLSFMRRKGFQRVSFKVARILSTKTVFNSFFNGFNITFKFCIAVKFILSIAL